MTTSRRLAQNNLVLISGGCQFGRIPTHQFLNAELKKTHSRANRSPSRRRYPAGLTCDGEAEAQVFVRDRREQLS